MKVRELQKLSRVALEGVKAIRELKAAREQHVEAIRQIDAAMGGSTKQEVRSTATKEPAKKPNKANGAGSAAGPVAMPKIPKAPVVKQAKPAGEKGKRVLSPEARERIAEAQRRRWHPELYGEAPAKGKKAAGGKPKVKRAGAGASDEPERGAVPMFNLEDALEAV